MLQIVQSKLTPGAGGAESGPGIGPKYMDVAGITHLHHFFLPRALHAISKAWALSNNESDDRIRSMLICMMCHVDIL